MTALVYPFASESDVALTTQATGALPPNAMFTQGTVPTSTQAVAFIRQAAGYFVRNVEGAGYIYSNGFVHKDTKENDFDDPTIDLVTFIVATIATGRINSLHIIGEKGSRQNGYWYTGNKMLDDIRAGKIVLPFSYRNGTTAAYVNTQSDVPVWADVAVTAMMSLPEYAIWVERQRGPAGWSGYYAYL